MTTPHLLATLYSLPNGRQSLVQIKNVGSEDMLWFKENRIRLSMEQLRDGNFAVYGRWPEQEEEDEELVFSLSKSCQETMEQLRKQLEKSMP